MDIVKGLIATITGNNPADLDVDVQDIVDFIGDIFN